MNQVELNKQAKLSEHFSLGELTKTKHVTADGNIPSREVIENLKRLCWWLEELRYSYNTLYCLQPGEDYETSENVEGIVVNSGYRSPAVNKLAGGEKETGLATDDCGPCVDLFDVVADAVLTLVEILRTNLDFDLLGGVGYQIAQVALYL